MEDYKHYFTESIAEHIGYLTDIQKSILFLRLEGYQMAYILSKLNITRAKYRYELDKIKDKWQ